MSGLTALEFLNGIFAIVIIIFFFFMGISIIRKYFQFHDRRLLFTGIAIFFMSSPWLPISISFISTLVLSFSLPFELYFTLGYGFSFGILFWLFTFTDMVAQKYRKVILGIYAIYLTILTILFYVFLIGAPNLIGNLSGTITADHGLYLRIRNAVRLIIILISGFAIWYMSKDSPNSEVRFKGRMIFIGIILFALGGFVFTITNISVFPLIFFIPSLFGIYAGFALPNWMKRFFLSEE